MAGAGKDERQNSFSLVRTSVCGSCSCWELCALPLECSRARLPWSSLGVRVPSLRSVACGAPLELSGCARALLRCTIVPDRSVLRRWPASHGGAQWRTATQAKISVLHLVARPARGSSTLPRRPKGRPRRTGAVRIMCGLTSHPRPVGRPMESLRNPCPQEEE